MSPFPGLRGAPSHGVTWPSDAKGTGVRALVLCHVLPIAEPVSVLAAGWILWLCSEAPAEKGCCPGQVCSVQGALRPKTPDCPELILFFSSFLSVV